MESQLAPGGSELDLGPGPSTPDAGQRSGQPSGWWSRECGLRDLCRLGLPLVISTTSYTALHFCDRLFLAWHSTLEMGAVMTGGAVTWTSLCLPMGIAAYATTFVAQYVGAGRHDQLGKIFWAAMRVGWYSFPLFLAFGCLAPWLLSLFAHTSDLQTLEVLYVQILVFGSPAAILATAVSALFIGQGHTRVVMVVDVVTAATNIVLDYVAIFGYWGLPAGGLQGAAWATVVAMWLKFALLLGALYLDSDRATYRLRASRVWDSHLLGRLLKFGVPNGLQFLQEAASFTLFLLFVGQLGPLATAATTLAINVNLVAFVPIMGIGMAVSTMVGQQVGRQRPELAERATWSGLVLAAIYSGTFALAYVLAPGLFMMVYRLDAPAQEELKSLAQILLRFVAAYCVLDAIQMVFVSAIKGAGDTWFAMSVSIVLMLAMVAAGNLSAWIFDSARQQLLGWWVVLTVWIWSLACVFFWRFRRGAWRSMTVVER